MFTAEAAENRADAAPEPQFERPLGRAGRLWLRAYFRHPFFRAHPRSFAFACCFGLGCRSFCSLWLANIWCEESRELDALGFCESAGGVRLHMVVGLCLTTSSLGFVNRQRGKSVKPHGQLVRLGSRLTPFTPAAYRRGNLPRPFRGLYALGVLILGGASHLDAFSGYPFPTSLPGDAPGGTTGTRVVGPSRSSRTRDGSPQHSNARDGYRPNCLTTF
jgi:hypothetical protein